MKTHIDNNFQTLQSDGNFILLSVYDTLTILHQATMLKSHNFAHKSPGFLSWHRYFVWLFERHYTTMDFQNTWELLIGIGQIPAQECGYFLEDFLGKAWDILHKALLLIGL